MKKINKSDADWQNILTPEQYRTLREKATDLPFTGQYTDTETPGTYICAGCGHPLFSSNTKYHSDCGWPSFWDVLKKGTVELKEDNNHGLVRTEVVCARCGGHLGHVFDDGPKDKMGLRYCINSSALNLKPETNP